MIHTHTASTRPLPSTILQNGVELRRQYTRAAAKRAVQFIHRKLRSGAKAATAATEMPQVQRGV